MEAEAIPNIYERTRRCGVEEERDCINGGATQSRILGEIRNPKKEAGAIFQMENWDSEEKISD